MVYTDASCKDADHRTSGCRRGVSSRHTAGGTHQCALLCWMCLPTPRATQDLPDFVSVPLLQVPTAVDNVMFAAPVVSNSQAPVTGVDVNPAAPVSACCTECVVMVCCVQCCAVHGGVMAETCCTIMTHAGRHNGGLVVCP
jgi:hypothetical protein